MLKNNSLPSIRQAVPIRLKNGVQAEFISFSGLPDTGEHIAIRFPGWDQSRVPMIRLHSECLTGDLFGSQRCDCGAQLEEAIEKFSGFGGILLYLRQEGRGIGLYQKLDAYDLQINQGMNTYDANLCLNREADERDYKVAANMLQAMSVKTVALLSNNPLKKQQLQSYGIHVLDMLPTKLHVTEDNKGYLKAKKIVGGHAIEEDI